MLDASVPRDELLESIRILVKQLSGPAPYDFSLVVANLKKEIGTFPKNLKFSKSSQFASFLEIRKLVKLVYPKGPTTIFLQPLVSPSKWIETLEEQDRPRVKREVQYYATPQSMPWIKFDKWSSFIDFIDAHPDLPMFQSPNIQNYGFWVDYNGTCYGIQTDDIPTFGDLVNMVEFGFELDNKTGGFANHINWAPLSISRAHHTLGKVYDEIIQQKKIVVNNTVSEINYHVVAHEPFAGYKLLTAQGFTSSSEAAEANRFKLTSQKHLDIFRSLGPTANLTAVEITKRLVLIAGGFVSIKAQEVAVNAGYLFKHEFEAAKAGNFSSPDDFRDAAHKGFSQYEEYKRIIKAGYKTRSDFTTAEFHQIDNADDFYSFQNGGFPNKRTYFAAKQLKLGDINSYTEWINQRDARIQGYSATLLKLLPSLTASSYSMKQFRDFFPNIQIFENDLEHLFSTNPEFSKLGSFEYDRDTNVAIFQRGEKSSTESKSTLSSKNGGSDLIVVDASNVAWHGQDRDEGEKPLLSNLLLMKKNLEERGLKNYLFIAKSNLPYVIDDKEGFDKLFKGKKFKKSPAGGGQSVDDEFILKTAITKGGLVVTLDQFKDFQERNPQLASIIKHHRVGFQIFDDAVTFDSKIDDWLSPPSKGDE